MKNHSNKLGLEYLIGIRFPVLEVQNSKIDGSGIFAAEHIEDGGPVCPLYGALYNIAKAKINYPKYSYQISDEIAIETSNEPGFFNHSCEPNVFINQDWQFEAMKEIRVGEEIVVDYGTVDYFQYAFKCRCGTLACRKEFNGNISADKPYQVKMGKYFSPYLKKRFSLP